MVWAGEPEQVAIARAARDEDATAPTERDANARLIAAAPELLAALDRLVSLNRTQGVSDDDYEDAMEAADAVLTKAFGA